MVWMSSATLGSDDAHPPEYEADLEQLIASAAAAQSVDPGTLGYRLLPVESGGRATLDAMRAGLGATVLSWPGAIIALAK